MRDQRPDYLDDEKLGTGKPYFKNDGPKRYGFCRYGEHWVERGKMISFSVQAYIGVGGQDYERIAGKVCEDCRADAIAELRDMLGWDPRMKTANELAMNGVEGFESDDSEAAMRKEGRDFQHPFIDVDND